MRSGRLQLQFMNEEIYRHVETHTFITITDLRSIKCHVVRRTDEFRKINAMVECGVTMTIGALRL